MDVPFFLFVVSPKISVLDKIPVLSCPFLSAGGGLDNPCPLGMLGVGCSLPGHLKLLSIPRDSSWPGSSYSQDPTFGIA